MHGIVALTLNAVNALFWRCYVSNHVYFLAATKARTERFFTGCGGFNAQCFVKDLKGGVWLVLAAEFIVKKRTGISVEWISVQAVVVGFVLREPFLKK